MRNLLKFIILVVCCLQGCKSIGPNVLKSDRFNYNLAMAKSSQQELLLNMVRLRYDEAPMVLKVGNISGNTSIEAASLLGGGATFGLGRVLGQANSESAIKYVDSPIVNYTPLDDEDFTKHFLQSLDLSDIGLLLQSSWSVPRVFRVTLQRAGKSVNAPSSARSTSSHVPEYQDFIEMSYVLRRAQINNAFTIFYDKVGIVENLIFVFRPGFSFTAKDKVILQKAGVIYANNRIIFSNAPGPNKTYVITRSMLGVLNYLSKGIEVPSEDVKDEVVVQTVYTNGTVFDWQNVLRGMMKIYTADKYPRGAIVAIPYRGRWYYIKDKDHDSKQTLILLANIAGLISRTPPDSDVPVGLTRVAR